MQTSRVGSERDGDRVSESGDKEILKELIQKYGYDNVYGLYVIEGWNPQDIKYHKELIDARVGLMEELKP